MAVEAAAAAPGGGGSTAGAIANPLISLIQLGFDAYIANKQIREYQKANETAAAETKRSEARTEKQMAQQQANWREQMDFTKRQSFLQQAGNWKNEIMGMVNADAGAKAILRGIWNRGR